MEDWLETWTKVYHHHYTVVAILGLLATVLFASPGESVLALGPLRLDIFYATLGAFGLLFLLSVTDSYDRTDYALDRDDTEE